MESVTRDPGFPLAGMGIGNNDDQIREMLMRLDATERQSRELRHRIERMRARLAEWPEPAHDRELESGSSRSDSTDAA